MTLDPILTARPIIQFHIAMAMVSLVLVPWVLWRERRDRLHKVLGYVWVIAMASLAFSSFFIHSFALIGPFSPIHLLSVVTLVSLWLGIRHARAGRIAAHRATYRNLYYYGLCVAGGLNFLPGRLINKVVLGGVEAPLLIACVLIVAIVWVRMPRRGDFPLGIAEGLFYMRACLRSKRSWRNW